MAYYECGGYSKADLDNKYNEGYNSGYNVGIANGHRVAYGGFTNSSTASGTVTVNIGFQPRFVCCFWQNDSKHSGYADLNYNGSHYHLAVENSSGMRSTSQMITFTSSGFIHKSGGQSSLLGKPSVYIAFN